MAKFDNNRFESKKQEYETPDNLFAILDSEFHFTIDVCANQHNAKVEKFYSEEDDGLTQDWEGVCWMNPPYDKVGTWIKKAYEESRKDNCIVVCLIPARINNQWWHNYCMKGEIRFIKGRPKFKGCKYGLPQPLSVIIFGKEYLSNYKSVEFD